MNFKKIFDLAEDFYRRHLRVSYVTTKWLINGLFCLSAAPVALWSMPNILGLCLAAVCIVAYFQFISSIVCFENGQAGGSSEFFGPLDEPFFVKKASDFDDWVWRQITPAQRFEFEGNTYLRRPDRYNWDYADLFDKNGNAVGLFVHYDSRDWAWPGDELEPVEISDEIKPVERPFRLPLVARLRSEQLRQAA